MAFIAYDHVARLGFSVHILDYEGQVLLLLYTPYMLGCLLGS